MSLDPQVKAFLDLLAAEGAPPRESQTVAEARRQMLEQSALRAGPPQPMTHVENRIIAGPDGDLPVRIYHPESAGAGPLPILVYFHGGGWVLGNLDSHDVLCRALAHGARAGAVSVDYRLAPEHPFPAAAEDAYAATAWAAVHAAELGADPARLAVVGDSAGGNLAAVTCLLARERRAPRIAFQALIYPVTEHYNPGQPSYFHNGEGYSLTRDGMIWYWDHYLPDSNDAGSPLASPLRALDLRDLPPAFVVTAEYDPLRDEGEAYAARLRAAGVPVTLHRYDGVIHGIANMAGVLDAGKRVQEEVGAALRVALCG